MADSTTHHISTPDGVRVTYHTWGDEFRSVRPTVVLVHGFMANTRLNWVVSGAVDAFLEDDRHVVAVDLRAHGETGIPDDPTRLSERHMAEDVSAVLDEVGVERVQLVGFAMGAVVASFVALSDPRVTRLVLGGIGASLVERGGHDTGVIPLEEVAHALETPSPAELTTDAARTLRSFADLIGIDRAAMAAVTRARNTAPIDLSSLAVPTLVYAAEHDEFAQRPEVLAAAIPNATLHVAEGDHFILMSEAAFIPAVVGYLRED